MDSFDREALVWFGALSAVLFHSTAFLDFCAPVFALLLSSVPCNHILMLSSVVVYRLSRPTFKRVALVSGRNILYALPHVVW